MVKSIVYRVALNEENGEEVGGAAAMEEGDLAFFIWVSYTSLNKVQKRLHYFYAYKIGFRSV